MQNGEIEIRGGKPTDATAISDLIIQAMPEECCQFFYGESHTLEDFRSLMTELVGRTDTQYSHQNCLCAVDAEDNVVGICVSYDGGRLHELRRVFISLAKEAFGIDHSGIDDETEAGELYIDSLATNPDHRGKGIATQLIEATAVKASKMGIERVGLLVDKGNPNAERLYLRCGFKYQNDNSWGGHAMKHLVRLTDATTQ